MKGAYEGWKLIKERSEIKHQLERLLENKQLLRTS
jgi:hypothetical protein